VTREVSAEPLINVLDPAFYVDPWDGYRWLRQEAPVFWDPVQKLWAISRHDDIMAVERDGARYSSFQGSRPHLDLSADLSMINLDEPEHQAQRSLVSGRFTPRAVRHHEVRIRQIAAEILGAVAPLGECEAIESIASRLPAMMIGELLGYPPEQWERVRYWSEQVMMLAGQTSPEGPPHVTHPGLIPVMQDWAEVTVGLIKERRAEPRDDLISLWVHTNGWDTKRVLDAAARPASAAARQLR
jgi:cytochrome P450 family 142 subfamily A polypeptide 1